MQVQRLAREYGLIKLGTVAVDGTKLNANGSRQKAMSYDHLLKAERELKAQIDGLLKRTNPPAIWRKTSPIWTSPQR